MVPYLRFLGDRWKVTRTFKTTGKADLTLPPNDDNFLVGLGGPNYR